MFIILIEGIGDHTNEWKKAKTTGIMEKSVCRTKYIRNNEINKQNLQTLGI